MKTPNQQVLVTLHLPTRTVAAFIDMDYFEYLMFSPLNGYTVEGSDTSTEKDDLVFALKSAITGLLESDGDFGCIIPKLAKVLENKYSNDVVETNFKPSGDFKKIVCHYAYTYLVHHSEDVKISCDRC